MLGQAYFGLKYRSQNKLEMKVNNIVCVFSFVVAHFLFVFSPNYFFRVIITLSVLVYIGAHRKQALVSREVVQSQVWQEENRPL